MSSCLPLSFAFFQSSFYSFSSFSDSTFIHFILRPFSPPSQILNEDLMFAYMSTSLFHFLSVHLLHFFFSPILVLFFFSFNSFSSHPFPSPPPLSLANLGLVFGDPLVHRVGLPLEIPLDHQACLVVVRELVVAIQDQLFRGPVHHHAGTLDSADFEPMGT